MTMLDSLAAKLGQAVVAQTRGQPGPLGAAPDLEFFAYKRAAAPGALKRAAAPAAATPSAPVIQLNLVPTSIAPDLYRDPKTPTNPNGTLTSLYAFRTLVDPIPVFGKYYAPSSLGTEQAYGNLVEGAACGAAFPFAQQVIAGARQKFALSSLPSLDGTPSPWRAVYADPPDWYAADASRFEPLTVSGSTPFLDDSTVRLGAPAVASWQVLNDQGVTTVATDPATRILSTSMRYLVVNLQRPWLDFSIFRVAGWALQGEPVGFISSGNVTDNGGLMPLLPTSFVLGIDIALTAQWGPSDAQLLARAAAQGQEVVLGPLRLQPQAGNISAGAPATLSSSQPAIVGWVSSLVPLSPPQ